ncbi:MAG: ribosome biogenesis GTPase Der [Eubacteriaceae bacterium]|jgi:GTP-binding protein|nr:ribosome biogenesis GTPase Der [Eubacteriaceae bacterium]
MPPKARYIALVGRPNTGKSTLFNRLAGRRISLVDDMPGVTRDRVIAEAIWLGQPYYVIDTGGIEPDSRDPILQQMRRQALVAMEMADAIVLVVDGREGATASDMEIADMIRKRGAKAVVAANKLDDPSIRTKAYDFYSLSLGDPIAISAEHGMGIGDMLDSAFEIMGGGRESAEEPGARRIAVVGKPNAGKSTLVNLLCGEERVIVDERAGTTRDAVDTAFRYNGEEFTLIDTAGLKKRAKADSPIGYYASLRAAKAIERSELCLFLIDAAAGVTEQDTKIASQILASQKALVIVVNKWDLVEKSANTMAEMEKTVRSFLYFVNFAPIVFISAKEGKRMDRLMAAVEKAFEGYTQRVSTGLVNEAVSMALSMNPPPSKGGRHLKVYYASQVAVSPPKFVFFVNDGSLMNKPYERYMESKLRDAFGFPGTPLSLVFRTRSGEGQ